VTEISDGKLEGHRRGPDQPEHGINDLISVGDELCLAALPAGRIATQGQVISMQPHAAAPSPDMDVLLVVPALLKVDAWYILGDLSPMGQSLSSSGGVRLG